MQSDIENNGKNDKAQITDNLYKQLLKKEMLENILGKANSNDQAFKRTLRLFLEDENPKEKAKD